MTTTNLCFEPIRSLGNADLFGSVLSDTHICWRSPQTTNIVLFPILKWTYSISPIMGNCFRSLSSLLTIEPSHPYTKYILYNLLFTLTADLLHRPRQLNILILGLDGAGKTEVKHVLWNKPRTDFNPTTGCSSESFVYEDTKVQLSELGGAQGIRDIWKYYYPRVGVSYIWT